MAEGSLDTLLLHQCVQRWQAGDAQAADTLFRAVGLRLEKLTRQMLRGFPAVRACTETADVLQGSLLRLLCTLRRLQPQSTRHFFNLAAVQIRRELLDLARQFAGATFARPAAPQTRENGAGAMLLPTAAAPAEDEDLDLWCRFHQAVDRLAPLEREVLGLAFYHGWTQGQIAALFQVDERTVRRRWRSACLRLHRELGGRLPEP